MKTPSFRPDRRRLIKGAALWSAASLAPLLASCGGSAEDGRAGRRRESRTLHFDLSGAPIAAPMLFALGSGHHQRSLRAHDGASRERYRSRNAALQGVDDSRLTHYLEEVDLPANSLQSILVFGTDPATGSPLLAGAHIHAPLDSVMRSATLGSAAASPSGDVNAYSTPRDVGVFLVFHHPEVMNLDPDLGLEILNRIDTLPCTATGSGCTPFLDELLAVIALKIQAAGYPSTTAGSWATLVPTTMLDGTAVLDANGKPVYSYELDDEVATAVGRVAGEIIKNLFDDPTFEGSNWRATEGIANTTSEAGVATAASARARPLAEEDGLAVSAQHGVGATIGGCRIDELTNEGRAVQLTVSNKLLRYLSVYVQYLDAEGNALPVANESELDSSRAKYNRLVPTNDQIMAIPVSPEPSPIDFTIPDEATQAKVYLGSLGLGGDAFNKEAVFGSILTLSLNIGIPTILLAAGAYGDVKELAEEGVDSLLKDEKLLVLLYKSVVEGLQDAGVEITGGIFNGAAHASPKPFLLAMGNVAIKSLLEASPTLVLYLGAVIGSQLLFQAAPLVGFALRCVAEAAEVAAIAETVGEILAHSAVTTNVVSLAMPSMVVIQHDPRNSRFPLSATRFEVAATYGDGATPIVMMGSVPQNSSSPIEVVLQKDGTPGLVPSGGTVTIEVSLFSGNGCLVGKGRSGLLVNLPSTAATIDITIQELLAPLLSSTTYQHDLKLAYSNGRRTWVSAPAPQLTRANLSSGSVAALNGVTVHTPSGMVGYGFFANGVPGCSGGQAGVFNTVQNLSIDTDAQAAFKETVCGYAQPVGILYDPLGEAVGGRHFFVQPDPDSQEGFHLRPVALDDTTPFAIDQTSSWGRFNNPLDSLVVMPSGYVVGVNRQSHKMEVLLLPSTPVDQRIAPTSVPFATMKCGKGTRPGLLDTPVAVATAKGAVLVLEQGNRRIQAFDPGANPVKLFQGGMSPFVPLMPESTAVYVDLAVESLGYMYVLSYLGNGLQPSDYRLDIYAPDGSFLCRTTGFAAGRIAVDLFRTVVSLNYEPLAGAPRAEPTLSQWLPVSPAGVCPSDFPSAQALGSTCSVGHA